MTVTVFSVVDGTPSTWVCHFAVWDIKTEIFGGELVRFPTAALVVILDNKPETVFKVEFNGEKRAFVVYVVPCFVSYSFVCSSFEELLRDVAASSLFKGLAGLENFLCSGRRQEVRFNVTRRRLMAGLDLSLLFLA